MLEVRWAGHTLLLTGDLKGEGLAKAFPGKKQRRSNEAGRIAPGPVSG
jgi:hypothetical protein